MTSQTLDLNGTTVTVNTDDTLEVYQITDTSGSHNGTLVVGAGATVIFDDATNAGFTATASAITVTVNGTADDHATFKSESTTPTNLWKLPVATTTCTLTRCDFYDYTGAHAQAGWIENRCYWEFDDTFPDLYCTIDELVNLTGTEHEDDALYEIITHATNEINTLLSMDGVPAGDYNDLELHSAGLNMSIAGLLTRYRMDGTKPASLSIGGFSMSDNIDGAINFYETKAHRMVDQYIRLHLPTNGTSRNRFRVYKVNG